MVKGEICTDVYVLQFLISTSSDWSLVEVSGLGQILTSEHEENVLGGEPRIFFTPKESSFATFIGKPAYDHSPVELTVDMVIRDPNENLMIEIKKGYIGETGIVVNAFIDGKYSTIQRFSHSNTPGDPATNQKAFTFDTKLLTTARIPVESEINSIPKQVFACYYPWYGPSVITDTGFNGSIHTPLMGPYYSLDETVMDTHVLLAKAAGVDGFLSSWWGAGHRDETAMMLLLDISKQHGFKVGVYYESYRGDDKPTQGEILSELQYIVELYGEHEAYLTLGGNPVIFVYCAEAYGRNPDFWMTIKTQLESLVGEVVLVGDFRQHDFFSVFDGAHIYNELNSERHEEITSMFTKRKSALEAQSLEEIIAEVKNKGKLNIDRKLIIGTVIPGYDDTIHRYPGQVLPRNNLETYDSYWQTIHEYDPDWVLVTSWNEWYEGTEIEPSVEHGFTYIHRTMEQAFRFKGEVPVNVEPLLEFTSEVSGEDAIITLSNRSDGPAFNIKVESDYWMQNYSILDAGSLETTEFELGKNVTIPIVAEYNTPDGSLHHVQAELFIELKTPENAVDSPTASLSDFPQLPAGKEIWVNTREFNVTEEEGVLKVFCSVDVLSVVPEIEYCSLDLYMDGKILQGKCWSSLPQLTNAELGIQAPETIGYTIQVTPPPGRHRFTLKSYARDKYHNWVSMESDPLIFNVPDAVVEVYFSDINVEEIGGNLVIDLTAKVDSYPPQVEYGSVTVYMNNQIYRGESWTNLSQFQPYAHEPINGSGEMCLRTVVPLTGNPFDLRFVAYARNTAEIQKKISFDYKSPYY
ncbi:MAG: glycoside hydrolase family 99-like domain-containing protein [Candidatus Bathyarchaeota archaeon]|nr:glycoside hydrolase family 99-like domain-containing protein [Candidatus Bathyarchaeota archaeon]